MSKTDCDTDVTEMNRQNGENTVLKATPTIIRPSDEDVAGLPLYRPTKANLFNMSELDEAKFADHVTTKPACKHTPRGEWYCQNSDCVVREVVIKVKLYGKRMPNTMKCPVCGTMLDFHHYLETETLLCVKGSNAEPA